MGIIVYNSLPAYIKKEFTNPTKFISLVKKFLCEIWTNSTISV